MDSQRSRRKSPHTSTRNTYRRKPSSSSEKLPNRHESSSHYYRKSPIPIRSAPIKPASRVLSSLDAVPTLPVSLAHTVITNSAVASNGGGDASNSRSPPTSVLKVTNRRGDLIDGAQQILNSRYVTASSSACPLIPTTTVSTNYASNFGRRTPNILRNPGNVPRRLSASGQFVAVQQSAYIAVQKMAAPPPRMSGVSHLPKPASTPQPELTNIARMNNIIELKGEPLEGATEQRITAVTLNEFTPISCVYSGFTHAHKNTMVNLARNFFSLYTPMIDSLNLTVLLVINYNKAICIEIQQRIFADFLCKLVPRMLENKVVPFALEIKDVPQNWIAQNKKVIEVHPHEISNVTTKLGEAFRDRDAFEDTSFALPLTVYLLIRRGYLMIKFVVAEDSTDVAEGNAFLRTPFSLQTPPSQKQGTLACKTQGVQTDKQAMIPHQFLQMQREQMEQVASMQQQMQKVAQMQIGHIQRVGRMQLTQMQHFTQIAQQIRTSVQLSEHVQFVAQRQLMPSATAPKENQIKNVSKYGISREVQTDELSLEEETIQMSRWSPMVQVLDTIEVCVHKLMSLSVNTVASMEVKLQKQKYDLQKKDHDLEHLRREKQELERTIKNMAAGSRRSISISRDHDDRKDRIERKSEDKENRRDDSKSDIKSRDFGVSKTHRNERIERPAGRSDRIDRSDRSERSDRSDRSERTDRTDRNNRDGSRNDCFSRDQMKKRRMSIDESAPSSNIIGHKSLRKNYHQDDDRPLSNSSRSNSHETSSSRRDSTARSGKPSLVPSKPIKPAIVSKPAYLSDLKPANIKITLPETEAFYQKCMGILHEFDFTRSKLIKTQDDSESKNDTVNLTEDDMPAIGDFLQFNDDDFFQFFNLPEFNENEIQAAFSVPENSIAAEQINQIIGEHEIESDLEFLECFFT